MVKYGLAIYGLTFFSQAINLSWYYRGIEKTVPITISQIFSSVINLVLILTIINDRRDIIYAVIVMTSISFMNSFVLLMLYLRKHKLKPMIDYGFIKNNLKESLPIAAAGLMISIYYNLDHVMLGYNSNTAELGFYAAAYKIILIALIPAGIIFQSFLPQFSKSINDFNLRNNLMEEYSKLMLITGAFFTTMIFLFAKEIIGITYGVQYINSIMLTQILAFNIFLVYLNMSYGNPLIAWNKQKLFSYPIIAAALGNIILNIILIPKYQAKGAAIATISSELIVMLGFIPAHFRITKKIHIKNILAIMICAVLTIILVTSFESNIIHLLRVIAAALSFFILAISFGLINRFKLDNIFRGVKLPASFFTNSSSGNE